MRNIRETVEQEIFGDNDCVSCGHFPTWSPYTTHSHFPSWSPYTTYSHFATWSPYIIYLLLPPCI